MKHRHCKRQPSAPRSDRESSRGQGGRAGIGNSRRLRRIRAAGVGGLGPGTPLSRPVREQMEASFGVDLDEVRIHRGGEAADAAAVLDAKAYTIGTDIVLGKDAPDPQHSAGLELLAHEIAHVLQQQRTQGAFGSEWEAEADACRAARAVAEGRPPDVRVRAEPGVVQMEPAGKVTKPEAGDAAILTASWPLLPKPGGSPALEQLAAGTRVTVSSVIGNHTAYWVTSPSGKTGVVGGHVLKKAAAKKPAVTLTPKIVLNFDTGAEPLVPLPILFGNDWKLPLVTAKPAPVPLTGTKVMHNKYFGGGTNVYTRPPNKLPINWYGHWSQRGLAAERTLINEYYSHLQPTAMPRGMPRIDLTFGGQRQPISGTVKMRGRNVPFSGWQVTGGTGVSLKTMDNVGLPFRAKYGSSYLKPGGIFNVGKRYVDKAQSGTAWGRNEWQPFRFSTGGTTRFPGAYRVEVNPQSRATHIQLRAEPDTIQQRDISRLKQYGRAQGHRVVITGPNAPKSTVINRAGNPAPARVPSAPPLTVSPKFQARQNVGNAAVLAISGVSSALNYFDSKEQKQRAQRELAAAHASFLAYQQQNPEMGATIWVGYSSHKGHPDSAHTPSARFHGVTVQYGKEPSLRRPDALIGPGYLPPTWQKIWIPPKQFGPSGSPARKDVQEKLDKANRWLARVQADVVKFSGESRWARAWYNRIRRVTPHLLDPVRAHLSSAKIAIDQARYGAAAESIQRARLQLFQAMNILRKYQGLPRL